MGYSEKNWVGVCSPLLRTLALFITKICDIPYPICDLTPYIKILLQTCIIISSLVQTNAKLP